MGERKKKTKRKKETKTKRRLVKSKIQPVIIEMDEHKRSFKWQESPCGAISPTNEQI